MIVYDIQKLVEASAPDTVYLIYDQEGNRVADQMTENNWYKAVDRFTWERATMVGKHSLRPFVKIHLV